MTDFLVTTVTLFMYEIMYEQYFQYAFLNKIQFYPLDLMCNFYETRRSEIEKQLARVEQEWSEGEFDSYVRRIWREHSSEKTLINTENFKNIEDLMQVFSCIGRKGLSQILRETLKNVRQKSEGFPNVCVKNTQSCEVLIMLLHVLVFDESLNFSTNLYTH